MKKLNNKGITLIELVVSFAIVAVAVIYLYQTLFTVNTLYKESKENTNLFVDVNYAFRMIDEIDNQKEVKSRIVNGTPEEIVDEIKGVIENYKVYDVNFKAFIIDIAIDNNKNYYHYSFKIDGKEYKLYKYIPKVNNE